MAVFANFLSAWAVLPILLVCLTTCSSALISPGQHTGGVGSKGWAFSSTSALRGGGGGWLSSFGDGSSGLAGGLSKLRASLDSMAESIQGGGAGKAKLLEGKWKKVSEVGQEEAMQQLALNIVFRKAAAVLSRLEIRASPTFEFITKGAAVISIKASCPALFDRFSPLPLFRDQCQQEPCR